MKISNRQLLLVTALAMGAVVASSLASGPAGAQGSDEIRKIPTHAETRAALMNPGPAESSPGEAGATTGSTSSNMPAGPIGATGQTMPSKLSQRNDIIDRTPIMAMPQMLSDEERRQIYQAAMADEAAAATGADTLAPASELSTEQALNGLHALPQGVQGIEGAKGLKYVKAKDKVLLVEPSTRIVVDEITL